MIKGLIQKLNKTGKSQNIFDPSRLNDPLTMQIEWTPAKKGGISFRTRKLVKVSPYRVEFKATRFALFFYSFFALAGTSLVIGYSLSKYRSNQLSFDAETVIPVVIGLVFGIAGGCLLYFGRTPIVFDKMKRCFWKGRKTPEKGLAKDISRDVIHFQDIYAIQLISEFVRSNISFYSYELNIVKKDGTRVNVIDHGSKEKLKNDAHTLSMFLNKPLWDAIPMD